MKFTNLAAANANRLKSCLFIVLCFTLVFSAIAEDPVGREAGRELAADITSRRPEENTFWKGTLKVTHADLPTLSIPISCRTVVEGETWSVSYETPGSVDVPAEKLVVEFSTNHPPVYHYQRAPHPGAPLGSARELNAAEADVPFAGSDFWLSDLAFQFLHWPDQDRLKGQLRRTRPCYVIESHRPEGASGVYAKVKTWIERESGMPIQAEAYSDDKKTIKEFELGSTGKIHGHYQVKNIRMYDRKTGSRTVIEFDFDDQAK